MVAGVAEEKLAGLGSLEVQVRVVFPGEADAAVHLNVLRGDVEVDLARVRLDQGRNDRYLRGVLGHCGRRVLHGGAQ